MPKATTWTCACGHRCITLETRHNAKEGYTRRRYECSACKTRVSTYEVTLDDKEQDNGNEGSSNEG